MAISAPLIEVRELCVDYWQQGRWVTVVEGLNLDVRLGETFGLVGESGCGKSTTANAMLGYRPAGSRYRKGSVTFDGKDLLALHAKELRRLVGSQISLVTQNPATALSPGMQVGKQIAETILVHRYCTSETEARKRTLDLIGLVSLTSPSKVYGKYPHQLSGGQQQRIQIAMALACDPRLVVLDEPTTGLDVTTQAQVLDLLMDLRAQYGLSMCYITHNLGVVAQICDRIGVMYAGQLVEVAPRHELFSQPRHPYTHGLIASVPQLSSPLRKPGLLLKGLLRRDELPSGCPFAPRCEFAMERCYQEHQELIQLDEHQQVACWRVNEIPAFRERIATGKHTIARPTGLNITPDKKPLLEVKNLQAGYVVRGALLDPRRRKLLVVQNIGIKIRPGETFALVGESGSGKTTIARALAGLLPFVSGEVRFDYNHDLTVPAGKRSRELLRLIQFIFQNPDASLNPRQTIAQIIGRPLRMFFNLRGQELQTRTEKLLDDVRLEAGYAQRYPDELSGGERQRIALARALAAEPRLILCDEILSALDVSVQANVLELMIDLQVRTNIAYLFITHDLAVVRSLAHQVGVMYGGNLCESGSVEEVFNPPFHPYTDLLISTVPEADPNQVMPSMRLDQGVLSDDRKTACPYASRCPWKLGSICDEQEPPWQATSESHHVRCHIPLAELRSREMVSRHMSAMREPQDGMTRASAASPSNVIPT